MSIINQMLKDLEKRSLKSDEVIKRQSPVFLASRARKDRFRRIFWVLFFVAGMLLVFDLYVIAHHITKREAPHHARMGVAVTSPVSLPPAVPINPAPVRLTGMTVDFKQGMTRLRFLLTAPVFYRISSDEKATVYRLVLDHTRPAMDLPVADYTGTAIETLRMYPLPDGSLQIMLQLKKGSRLKQAGIFSETLPEFQMTLISSSLPISPPASQQQFSSATIRSQPVSQDIFSGQSLRKIQALEKAGEINKAISLLNSVITISPDFHPARETWIRILMQQGRMDEAGDILRIGRTRYPKWLPYINLQARWLTVRGQVGAALALLSHYTPSLQKHPEYYDLMAALYQRQHQPQMAARLYRQLLSYDPHNARFWLGYAIALDTSQQPAEAMNAYRRSLGENGMALSPELRAWVETQLHLGG